MNLTDINDDSDRKTIFIRKNGQLKAIRVKRSRVNYDKDQKPMFPIVKDRDEKSK